MRSTFFHFKIQIRSLTTEFLFQIKSLFFTVFVFTLPPIFNSLSAQDLALLGNIKSHSDSLAASLVQKLETSNDSLRVRILNQLCWLYRSIDFAKSIRYGKEALTLAESRQDKPALIEGLNFIGVTYRNVGNYPLAIESFIQAKKFSAEIGDLKQKAYALNNLGDIYRIDNQLDAALNASKQALAIFDSLGENNGSAYAHLRIGEAFQALGNFQDALKSFGYALKIREKEQDKTAIRAALSLTGECYAEMGNHRDALQYHFKALALAEAQRNPQAVAVAVNNIARSYLMLKKYSESLDFAKRGLQTSQLLKSPEQTRRSSLILSDIFASKGDYATSLQYLRNATAIRDSLIGEETKKRIAAIQAGYDAEVRQAQIEMLTLKTESQRILQNGFTIGLVLLGIIIVLILFAYRSKRLSARELAKQNTEIEAERSKSDKLLLNILPESIAERLKKGESVIADSFPDCTILFADLVGFTKLSIGTTPEALVTFLNDIFSRFDSLAEFYGLEKIKTIGDSYMAAGGIPKPQKDHAKRVAEFALAMQGVIRDFDSAGSVNLAIRIGIHSGPVVAGVIGDKKFIYDLWGDTVNTASRLESQGIAGEIQVSETTFQLIEPYFTSNLVGN
ncbi:MAG: adenylate/guanylate cyclase domain-containing protein [Chloroherpetonaceae bacterium]|nr:adenylate/guanylate cyclase domain-containing protein [Chloroherpetonaceae bacterium]